jgi:hypothetical protein
VRNLSSSASGAMKPTVTKQILDAIEPSLFSDNSEIISEISDISKNSEARTLLFGGLRCVAQRGSTLTRSLRLVQRITVYSRRSRQSNGKGRDRPHVALPRGGVRRPQAPRLLAPHSHTARRCVHSSHRDRGESPTHKSLAPARLPKTPTENVQASLKRPGPRPRISRPPHSKLKLKLSLTSMYFPYRSVGEHYLSTDGLSRLFKSARVPLFL